MLSASPLLEEDTDYLCQTCERGRRQNGVPYLQEFIANGLCRKLDVFASNMLYVLENRTRSPPRSAHLCEVLPSTGTVLAGRLGGLTT